jgi:hypothetical protein
MPNSFNNYHFQWIQNYGLVNYSATSGGEMRMNEPHTELTLVSFSNQPLAVIPKENIDRLSPGNKINYTGFYNQIHWRGLSTTDHLSVQLFDFTGKLIYSFRQLPGSFILNTSQFSNGAYIIKYQVNNEMWKHFSFVRN